MYTFNDYKQEIKAKSEESRKVLEATEKVVQLVSLVAARRIAQGLTQQQLAEKCGLKQSAIARFEGVESIPRSDTLIRIAEALQLELTLTEKTEMHRKDIGDNVISFYEKSKGLGYFVQKPYIEELEEN